MSLEEKLSLKGRVSHCAELTDQYLTRVLSNSPIEFRAYLKNMKDTVLYGKKHEIIRNVLLDSYVEF